MPRAGGAWLPGTQEGAGVVRGEPGYPDQVPRRQAYEAAHPETEIIYRGAYWQAIIREPDGETVTVRYTLRELLDKLDGLAGG
jgi:hypothetical protein